MQVDSDHYQDDAIDVWHASNQDGKLKVGCPFLPKGVEIKQNIWKIQQKHLVSGVFYQHIYQANLYYNVLQFILSNHAI